MSIGSAVRFKYGQSVVLHATLNGVKTKMDGVVIRSQPLEVSVHGVRISCDQATGAVNNEGFPGAFIKEKEK
jgi:hypothetical protein